MNTVFYNQREYQSFCEEKAAIFSKDLNKYTVERIARWLQEKGEDYFFICPQDNSLNLTPLGEEALYKSILAFIKFMEKPEALRANISELKLLSPDTLLNNHQTVISDYCELISKLLTKNRLSLENNSYYFNTTFPEFFKHCTITGKSTPFTVLLLKHLNDLRASDFELYQKAAKVYKSAPAYTIEDQDQRLNPVAVKVKQQRNLVYALMFEKLVKLLGPVEAARFIVESLPYELTFEEVEKFLYNPKAYAGMPIQWWRELV